MQERERRDLPDRPVGFVGSLAVGVVEEFIDEADFPPGLGEIVAGFLRSQRMPVAVVQTLRMHLAGELGHQRATAEEIALAVQQFCASGEMTFKPAYFAGFLTRVRGKHAQARETAQLAQHEQRRAAEEVEVQERGRIERERVEGFPETHPARFAELVAEAQRQVDSDHPNEIRGRAVLVRGRLQELLLQEVRRAPR